MLSVTDAKPNSVSEVSNILYADHDDQMLCGKLRIGLRVTCDMLPLLDVMPVTDANVVSLQEEPYDS